MAVTTYTGTGVISSADFKTVKFVGKTKGGQAVTITLDDAINMGNIDWTFAEKDDTVAQVVFEATYDNTDEIADSTAEPFKVEIADGLTAGAGEILLGVGKFYIGSNLVALTRGGGSFNVEREFREINADGDRGAVKDRVVIESSRARLTLNALTILTKVNELYPGINKA